MSDRPERILPPTVPLLGRDGSLSADWYKWFEGQSRALDAGHDFDLLSVVLAAFAGRAVAAEARVAEIEMRAVADGSGLPAVLADLSGRVGALEARMPALEARGDARALESRLLTVEHLAVALG